MESLRTGWVQFEQGPRQVLISDDGECFINGSHIELKDAVVYNTLPDLVNARIAEIDRLRLELDLRREALAREKRKLLGLGMDHLQREYECAISKSEEREATV